ncbi:MAG: gliding motility-associated C-terminal domain-containing protein [Bacteroidota bacterium]
MKTNFQVSDFMFRILLIYFLYFSIYNLQSFAQTSLSANAGPDTGNCPSDGVTIGGTPAAAGGTSPYTYSWSPATNISNPNIPNPKVSPTTPTSYVLQVTDATGDSISDVVYVTNYSKPIVSAGADVTIMQGSSTVLQGSGAVIYNWHPANGLLLQNTANPVAEPNSTTTYYVAGQNGNGCLNYDTVIVFVIPGNTLIIYNTFTPNEDGVNDSWYIGNLGMYPKNKMEIYNRNGKLVYIASPYLNNWTGKIKDAELPAATYYYIIDTGIEGKEKIKGAVTIIR